MEDPRVMVRAKRKYPNLPEDFRSLVRETRLSKQITLTAMAKDIGVYPATISQYEKGERNFSYERAVQFRDYLEMDYALPDPDISFAEPISRNRKESKPIENEGFYVIVEGEIIEVLTFRRLGPATKAKIIDR